MNFAPYAPPPDEYRPERSSKPSRQSQITSNNHQTPPPAFSPSNPWSSYHSGGSGVDPSRFTSYSSQQAYQASSTSENRSGLEPGSSRQEETDAFLPAGRPLPRSEAYETRFGWRVDLLSALSYCTPLMAILMLIIETRNDFVRIHAYQSLLVALPLALLHLLFLSSHFLQVFLFIVDLGLYGWLAYQAYLDAEMLVRRLLPVVGPLAERWTEDE